MKAACSGCNSSPRATPSMVVMSQPSWLMARVRHELMRRPSTRMVQAPHWPRSHPFLVPVRSNCSRRRSRSVTRGSASAISRRTPFTVRLMEWFMQGSDQCYGRAIARPLAVGADDDHQIAWSDIRRHPPLYKGWEAQARGLNAGLSEKFALVQEDRSG